MFTIIGKMAEIEATLISERVQAGMQAAEGGGMHLGRPPTPDETLQEIERLAGETDLFIRTIKKVFFEDARRGVVSRLAEKVAAEE
jgi:DNA invertase Pin-like site-specific DNA recombinase